MNRNSSNEARIQPMRERIRQATRATILQAAERVFSDRGIGAARMEEIAEQAGLAVGTIYNYFDDRHALLQAVLDASAAELEQRLVEAESKAEEPFKRQVERFFAKVLEHQRAHFRLFAILAQEEAGLCRPPSAAEPHRLRLKALHLLAERLVARGVAQGALRAEDADLFPTFLSNMLRGLFIRDLLATGGPPRLEEAPRLARFFLHGAGGHR